MIRFGILTISDRSFQGERTDLSGPALAAEINQAEWRVSRTGIVPDELDEISQTLRDWCDSGDIDILLTTGGTGFASRDVTPEATLAVITRQAPGLVEAMRMESIKVTPHAMLSRAVSGIYKNTLVINLPGSPKGAVESFRVVLPVLNHAVELITSASIPDSHHTT